MSARTARAMAIGKMCDTPVTASTPHSHDAQTVLERLAPTIKLPK